jgi:hypothetical protein
MAFAVLRYGSPPNIPLCLFHALTGSPCPLCGVTRAMFALAKGNLLDAVQLHALSPLVLVLVAGFAALKILRWEFRLPKVAWNGIACVFLSYGLLRMLSGTPVYAQDAPPDQKPKLFTIGGEMRGRFEAFTGQNFVVDRNDEYYLSRFRFTLGVQPLSWLSFRFQVQDSLAPGYREPKPSSVLNPFDLRVAYMELRRDPKAAWLVRVGRQEFIFGEERLVGAGNWGNVGRSFDAARVTYETNGKKLDWFASSVVAVDKAAFDRSDWRNRFYGFYSSFEKVVPRSVVEPYVFWRSEAGFRNELRQRGRLEEVTMGVRAVGKLPARFDYGLETALQAGRAAGLPIRAWAGHYLVGYSIVPKVRLTSQFNLASGDNNPKDGRLGTFDQLYPTNHGFYGVADRIGWRNMREANAGLEWRPLKKWRFMTTFHSFWLGTTQDYLYFDNGSAFVRNPLATSRHIDNEMDILANYEHNKHFSLVIGYSHIFPKTFLKQSTPSSPVTAPYAMWLWRF